MRIGIVSQSFFPIRGGVAEHVYYTAQTPGFSYFLIGEKIPEEVLVKEITEEGVTEKIVLEEVPELSKEALAGAA